MVAISNDETGISEDPDVRYEVAKRDRRAGRGPSASPASDVVVDPAGHAGGRHGYGRTPGVRRLPFDPPAARRTRSVNTTCGASNISFGLPNRHALNGSMFLAMAIGRGMTSAIMNPLHLPRR